MRDLTTITLALDSEELTNLMSNLPLDEGFLQWIDIQCTHFEEQKAVIDFAFDINYPRTMEKLLEYCIAESEGRKSVFDKGVQMIKEAKQRNE